MKKIVLTSIVIASVATSALYADMMTNMAKDVAVSKAKTQAKETIIKQVAGNDPVKQQIAKKVADKVVPEPSATDKIKSAVADKVMGAKDTSTSGMLKKAVSSKTKEPSMKEKATDMAVEKVVGSNPLKKEAAKGTIKSLGM
jgi:hypothetical protein